MFGGSMGGTNLDANLLVDCLLLVLDLLFELLELGTIWCCAICLQHLDVSVCAGLANVR
jgi:hypothetical protein